MINIMYNFQSMIERDYFEGLVTQHLILLVYHVNSWKNNYSLCIKWCLVLELALWACCSVSQSCLTLCDPMDYRTTSHQASLSFTISWSLLKLTSIQLVIPSNHLILCCPLLLLPSIFPKNQGLFKWISFLHQMAKVLELQLQHQSFQWTLRTDLL